MPQCKSSLGQYRWFEPGEGRQQVTGVGDGGVGKHPLHVFLAQRGEIAHGHGKDGHDPQQRRPEPVEVGEHLIDHAQQQREGGGFGCSREQRNHRCRSAFVHVGSPNVEGRGGNLEENADQHERHSRQDKRMIRGGNCQMGDLVDLGSAGGPKISAMP